MVNELKAMCLLAFFWLICLSASVEKYGIKISYIDELLVVLLLPLNFKYTFERKIFTVWIVLLVFILYAVTISYFSPYCRGIGLSLLDIFLFLKPILLGISLLSLSREVSLKFLKYLTLTGSIFIVLATLGYLINIIIPIFPAFDQRLGLNSYSFFLTNPGEFLNIIIILCLAIYAYSWKTKSNLIIFLGIILAMATLRFKAFVIIAFSIFAVLYLRKIIKDQIDETNFPSYRFKGSFLLRRFFWIILISLIPGWYQFKAYFLTEMTPRLFLIINALHLAVDFFPFGAGPGTYGSAVAKLFYSPVYLGLGFDGLYGLSELDTDFLSDSFWPMVIGQYGFIGLLFCIIIYIKLFKYFISRIPVATHEFISFLIISMSLALSTLGSAILIGSIGCLYVILASSFVRR